MLVPGEDLVATADSPLFFELDYFCLSLLFDLESEAVNLL